MTSKNDGLKELKDEVKDLKDIVNRLQRDKKEQWFTKYSLRDNHAIVLNVKKVYCFDEITVQYYQFEFQVPCWDEQQKLKVKYKNEQQYWVYLSDKEIYRGVEHNSYIGHMPNAIIGRLVHGIRCDPLEAYYSLKNL